MPFNEVKLTQAAACFLEAGGRTMNYMKLIKLMYLADRDALLCSGCPITTDCYVSMNKGPVLSRMLDLINSGKRPDSPETWFDYISIPKNYEVSLVKDCPKDELSPIEEDIILKIWKEYGDMSQWDLVDFTHTLPEWRNPDGSAIPIGYDDILRSEGCSDSEIAETLEELQNVSFMNQFAG